jgi:Family of unknown function (DUF5677)
MVANVGLLRIGDTALRGFEDFMRPLFPSDEESGRFFHVVSVLSDAAMSNYRDLRKAFLGDQQTLAAWSCRNLHEIAIFTKFALSSKENAAEFAADRLIDGHQIGTALKSLELALNPGLTVSALDPVIESFATQMKNEGVTRQKYLSTEKLAQQVGMRAEYETLNRLCSKFVHPTAWSLFTSDVALERFPGACEIFYGNGALHFTSVFATIAPHVRQWGLRHKT